MTKFREQIKLISSRIFGQRLVFLLKIIQCIFKEFSNAYYSQFGEDVVLRVLIGDKPKKGFYVDVGAYHPKHLSNTYFFYKKGWWGINIDLNPHAIQLFKKIRTRDININAAVSDVAGKAMFHSWGWSVFDTISSNEVKERRVLLGPEKEIREIVTERLEDLLDKNVPANQDIDILNIDAEGHDLEVLRSNNWQKYKPRFVVVEDHEKDIEKIIASEKYKFLTSLGYQLCSWTCVSLIFFKK